MDIAERVLNGDRRAVARLITMVENNHPEVRELMRELYPHTGKAHVIGITGAPGSGKSSLVNKMTGEYRKRGKSVGVIAVDPTSPFTGGALLGDRIRMQSHATDKEVFIRSMGTRGSLGGLSRATSDAITILDDLEMMIDLAGYGEDEWVPPILQTVAVRNEGIKELVDTIEEHMKYLASTGGLDKRIRDRVRAGLKDWIREEGVHIVLNNLKEAGEYEPLIDKMVKREVDPHTAAVDAIKRVRNR